MKNNFAFIVLVVCVLHVEAQQPGTIPPKATRTAIASPKGLTVENVIAMVQAGISDEIVMARLRKDKVAFDLSHTDLIALKNANVNDIIVAVMLDPETKIQSVQPGTEVGAVSVQPITVPFTTVSPFPVVASANPSGATPLSRSATGDPNDPLAPHDSGIYLLTKNREGRPQMVVLERAAYQGSKTEGLFASAMTSGIMKTKIKAIVPGARASIRIESGSAEFFFYFDDKAAGLGKSYFGLTNLSNPNQFALLRLEKRKGNRETTVGEASVFKATTGTHAKSMVTFKSERIRPGLYKVIPSEPLRPGEYCFLASSMSIGTHAAGAAGAVDIFDFGVNPTQ
jgi:hypothetical protein